MPHSAFPPPDPFASFEGREVLYRRLVAGMREGVVVETARDGIVSCNAAAERILGLSAERMEGRSAPDLRWNFYHEDGTPFPPEEHPSVSVLRSGIPENDVVMRFDRNDGSRNWIRISSRPLDPAPPGEAPDAVVTTFVDITAERDALDELRVAEQRYQALVETLPLVTYVVPVELEASATFISPQVEGMLGYSVEEWTDQEHAIIPRLLHPDDYEMVAQWYAETSTPSDEATCRTYRMVARDGRTVWVEDASKTVLDPVSGEPMAVGYLRDVTAEVDTQERLQSAHSRLSSLVADLGAAVLVEDEHGIVHLVNEEFCVAFGLTRPEDLVGRPVDEVITDGLRMAVDAEAVQAWITDHRASRERALGVMSQTRAGRILACDFLPTTSDGVARGAMWVFRDVTERETVRRELAAARDEALGASRAKTDFLATMSHEIRTPMNGIVATIELLEEHALDAEAAELVRIVRDAAQSLQSILDDVLDFSKIESGTQTLDAIPFDLAGTVRGVAELLTPAGTRKGVAVRAEIDPALPPMVTGDQGMVRQVLLNLAGNAVKFTATGSVVIAGRVLDPGEDHLQVTLSVTDTGPGISVGAQGRLYDPFFQADSSAHRQHGGTGLGLAITDRLVRMMDGTIAVDSTVGVGTTFTVTLPFAPAEVSLAAAVDPPPAAQPRPAGDLRGTVLLVEDNPANRAVGLRQLVRLGLDAQAVESGEEAVRAVVGGTWDCVLMDCQMPGMDGFAATRAIREAEGQGRRTPIVAMTANAMQGDREACLAAGMDDYLAKPVRLAPLGAMLAHWLDLDAPPPAAGPPTSAAPGDGPLDRAAVAELREDLGEDFGELVGLYLEQLAPRLAALRAGLDAGDLPAVRAAAHSLKGASGTYGALGLAARCAALEDAIRSGDGAADLPALLAAVEAEAEPVRLALEAERS